MSNFRGSRPNVNVSHFLANLNTIPSAEEQTVETFNPEDLALFTNTQFFDFDMGEPLGEFSAGNLHHSPTSTTPTAPIPLHAGFSHDTTFSGSAGSPAENASSPTSPQTINFPSNPMNTASTTAKRKSSIMESASPESLEESSRMAAEEDKRRRNTAASARFRIKKKQREQALEKSAKEMSDKVSALESKINQLEMENKWLKNLITEKNMGKKDGGLDISELFNAKFSAAASAPASLPKDKSNAQRI
ncbi:hypothetical protein DFH27DRAFT_508288 [Peziza echinospora]|nr:hypothetical protein DFH27DRAFT_508288 [Peziza echinospora]